MLLDLPAACEHVSSDTIQQRIYSFGENLFCHKQNAEDKKTYEAWGSLSCTLSHGSLIQTMHVHCLTYFITCIQEITTVLGKEPSIQTTLWVSHKYGVIHEGGLVQRLGPWPGSSNRVCGLARREGGHIGITTWPDPRRTIALHNGPTNDPP